MTKYSRIFAPFIKLCICTLALPLYTMATTVTNGTYYVSADTVAYRYTSAKTKAPIKKGTKVYVYRTQKGYALILDKRGLEYTINNKYLISQHEYQEEQRKIAEKLQQEEDRKKELLQKEEERKRLAAEQQERQRISEEQRLKAELAKQETERRLKEAEIAKLESERKLQELKVQEILKEKQDLIDNYIDKHGKIFDFFIDKAGNIRIAQYHDHSSREHIIIPYFVYGFGEYEGKDYPVKPIFPDLSHVKSITLGKGVRDLGYMFFKSGKGELDLSQWDTSEVTNMSGLFVNAQLSEVGDIGKWDTSQVTDMSAVFGSSALKHVGNIGNWDTSQVTNMAGIFYLSQLSYVGDIGHWDTSHVTNMTGMFLNSQLSEVGDLGNWDTSQVTNMTGLFAESKLSDVGNIGNWDTSQITDMPEMFKESKLPWYADGNKIQRK